VRVVRKIVEKKSWVLTPTGPSNVNVYVNTPAAAISHPRDCYRLRFRLPMISAEPGPLGSPSLF
jgi:hypothetical protein